jgi:hypothetical protein
MRSGSIDVENNYLKCNWSGKEYAALQRGPLKW